MSPFKIFFFFLLQAHIHLIQITVQTFVHINFEVKFPSFSWYFICLAGAVLYNLFVTVHVLVAFSVHANNYVIFMHTSIIHLIFPSVLAIIILYVCIKAKILHLY